MWCGVRGKERHTVLCFLSRDMLQLRWTVSQKSQLATGFVCQWYQILTAICIENSRAGCPVIWLCSNYKTSRRNGDMCKYYDTPVTNRYIG